MKKMIYTSDKVKRDIHVALLSDIHYREGFDNGFLIREREEIYRNTPEYLFILGDMINDTGYDVKVMKEIRDYIASLAKKTRVIAVLGNHDTMTLTPVTWIDAYNEEYVGMLRDIDGFTLLENSYYSDESFNVFGSRFEGSFYEDRFEPEEEYLDSINRYLSFEESDRLNIVLDHSPYRIFDKKVFDQIRSKDYIDLVISGHFHNGGVPSYIDFFLPGNFGFISPYLQKFPPHARGIMKINEHTTGVIASPVTTFSGSRGLLYRLNPLYPPRKQELIIKKA